MVHRDTWSVLNVVCHTNQSNQRLNISLGPPAFVSSLVSGDIVRLLILLGPLLIFRVMASGSKLYYFFKTWSC